MHIDRRGRPVFDPSRGGMAFLLILFFPCMAFSQSPTQELWMDDGSRRTDGLLHRLRSRIEAFDTEWMLRDSRKDRYRLSGNRLQFFLYDDNVSEGIPSVEEAAFFEARAMAFEKAGLIDRAVETYLALRMMDGRRFPVDAAAKGVAHRATHALHRLTGQSVQAARLAVERDPIVVADGEMLHILSDSVAFHLRLPGRFRFFRSLPADVRFRQEVYLLSGSRKLHLQLHRFGQHVKGLTEGGYTEYVDLLRGQDRQRKVSMDFERQCEKRICTVKYREKGVQYSYEEIQMVRMGAGFMLAVSPAGAETRSYLETVLSMARFQ